MIKKTIAVLGMRCAGCSASVEETLNKLEGVQSASVNLTSRSALIEFDEKRVTPERMKAALAEIGFDMVIDVYMMSGDKEKAAHYWADKAGIKHYRSKVMPQDKENLHALGHDAYYLNHDLEAAEFYLNEAIRISPNYLDPYFTLAQIYIEEGDLDHAKETVDNIYMDKDKKDILIRDIPFFEPDNIEATRQKIEADFEKTQQLKMVISSFSNLNEEKTTIQNEVQSKKTSVILQPL